MEGDPVILRSARRHGVRDDDMLHALRNPIRNFSRGDIVIVIGASRAGGLLEIGIDDSRPVRIVHAMRARRSFLERL